MKKTILVIDACVRQEESRTRKLLTIALDTMKVQHPDWKFEVLDLMKGDYTAPVFQYGNQFREADGIVVAAPFWDLSIPAVLKVYIENISADGITFKCDESGMHGICKGQWMLFLTTRGGIWADSHMELGSKYMEALCQFFGIDQYNCVYADGIDVQELDGEKILEAAIEETAHISRMLN